MPAETGKRRYIAFMWVGLLMAMVVLMSIPALADPNQNTHLSNNTSLNQTPSPQAGRGVTVADGTILNNTTMNGTLIDNTTTNGTVTNGATNNTVNNGTVPALGRDNSSVKFNSVTSQNDTTWAEGTITLLSPGTPDVEEQEAVIFGDIIIWSALSAGDAGMHLYDLATGNETIIVESTSGEPMPAIYGDRVVWQDTWNGNNDISLLNLTTGNVTHLTNDTVMQLAPSISGNNVVWEAQIDGEDIVYLCDVSTGIVTRVSNASTFQFTPIVSGDNIVWADWRNGNDSDIYLFNITTREERQITSDPGDETSPVIDGNRIAWVNYRNGTYDIYLYNLTSGNETRLTNDGQEKTYPGIYEDRVVWVEHEGAEHFIALYNGSTGLNKRITGDVGYEYPYPHIYGDRIVWTGGHNETTDVYMYTLGVETTCPEAGFHANVTSGDYPLPVRFTDDSSGSPAIWKWNFGDGNTSGEQNPVYTYLTPGIFSVRLTVTTPACRDAINKTGYITVGHSPTADFSSDIGSGPWPLTVNFRDLSSGQPENWSWDFGDNATSIEKNPVHVYASPGIYNVTLAVSNPFGNGSILRPGYITVMNSSRYPAVIGLTGLTTEMRGDRQYLILNASQNLTLEASLINNSLLTITPPHETSLEKMEIRSSDTTGFSNLSNGTIVGNITGIRVKSEVLTPAAFDEETGKNCSVQYTLDLPEYLPNAIIEGIMWEGIAPDESTRVSYVPNYSRVIGTAYTTQFKKEGINESGPATVIMGVNSTWVELHGQRYHGIIDLISEPEGANVVIDGLNVGTTPIELTLTTGNHTINLTKEGYDETLIPCRGGKCPGQREDHPARG